MQDERYLCSHLVRLLVDGSSAPPETVVLEEIAAESALVASDHAYPRNARVMIETEGFLAAAVVGSSNRRETDFETSLRFIDGCRWNRDAWEPEHLVRAKNRPRARGAAGGR